MKMYISRSKQPSSSLSSAYHSAITWPHLPASALFLTLHCGSHFLAMGQRRKKWVISKNPLSFSLALSLSTKLALIRFCKGLRIEFLHVTAMSLAEIWSSKTITVLERVVILFRKQDSVLNPNYDLRNFPLHSFAAFIAHLQRSIN